MSATIIDTFMNRFGINPWRTRANALARIIGEAEARNSNRTVRYYSAYSRIIDTADGPVIRVTPSYEINRAYRRGRRFTDGKPFDLPYEALRTVQNFRRWLKQILASDDCPWYISEFTSDPECLLIL